MAEETFTETVELDSKNSQEALDAAFGAGEIELEVGDDDDDVIIVEDDTPDADKGKPVAKAGDEDEDDLSDEEGNLRPDAQDKARYTKGVQKRIDKLVAARQAERRAKEKLFREHQEAIAFAKKLTEHQAALEERARKAEELNLHGEGVVIERSRRAVELEGLQAQAEYEAALNTGDPKAIVAANAKMAKAAQDAAQVQAWSNTYAQRLEEAKARAANPVQRQAPQLPQIQDQPVRRQDDPADVARRTDWQKRNAWFGQDKAMTDAARDIHVQLATSGVDPVSSPDLYWSTLDNRIRASFPAKFAAENAAPKTQTPGSVVAGVTRNAAGKNTRKVTLKASEVETAKALGLTPAQYAAFKDR